MHDPKFYVSRVPILAAMLAVSLLFSVSAMAQSSAEIFQDRLSALEEGLKDIRRIVEEDVRQLRQTIEDNGGVGGSEVENQVSALIDQIAALNRRIERTLQVATDNEFRLLRLEKQMEVIIKASIDGTSLTALGPNFGDSDSPANQGAGESPSSSLTSSENNQVTWTIGEEELAEQVAILPNPEDASVQTAEQADEAEPTPQPQQAEQVVLDIAPDASPDEYYQFALDKALQNDLDAAEVAFAQFVETHPSHERASDAKFWLGRVQFMNSSYQEAALTFAEFNAEWPEDHRREKTTLWIGESISYFAPTNETCELLETLPNLIADPSESFFERLEQLKTKAQCSG